MADKLVVYTGLASKGKLYNLLEPQKGIDYVCFTDLPFKSDVWDVRPFDYAGGGYVYTGTNDPVRLAKPPKILPHLYFPNHTHSVWIDGDMLLHGKLTLQNVKAILKDHDIAMYKHELRNDLYDEFAACVREKKDKLQVMRRQVERYASEGFPRGRGLRTAKVIYRRHTLKVTNAMELWWIEIGRGSRRDQLSFEYVVWKTGLNVKTIKGWPRRNKWFCCMKFAPTEPKKP